MALEMFSQTYQWIYHEQRVREKQKKMCDERKKKSIERWWWRNLWSKSIAIGGLGNSWRASERKGEDIIITFIVCKSENEAMDVDNSKSGKKRKGDNFLI